MTVFDRFPVDMPPGWISQGYGNRNTWEVNPHAGLDIAATAGTPIYAPCDAFVVWASFDPFPPGNTWEQLAGSRASGGCTILQPTGSHTSLQTSISHQMEIAVAPGQFVKSGQFIGRVGSTGNSSGPHVHWETFIDYAEGAYPPGTFYGRVNPLEYFKTVNTVPVLNTGGKGSTTPAQEEDDMFTDEDRRLLADVASRISVTNNTAKDAAARVSAVDANLSGVEKRVRSDIATVHNTIIKDVGSQLGNIQAGVTQKVDVDSLALELSGKLEARDLEALAAKLTVTVKEG